MTKDKTAKSLSPFENFKKFAQAIVAVPKKELDQKLTRYRRQRMKKKSS